MAHTRRQRGATLGAMEPLAGVVRLPPGPPRPPAPPTSHPGGFAPSPGPRPRSWAPPAGGRRWRAYPAEVSHELRATVWPSLPRTGRAAEVGAGVAVTVTALVTGAGGVAERLVAVLR